MINILTLLRHCERRKIDNIPYRYILSPKKCGRRKTGITFRKGDREILFPRENMDPYSYIGIYILVECNTVSTGK